MKSIKALKQWRLAMAKLAMSNNYTLEQHIIMEDFRHHELLDWSFPDQKLRFYNGKGSLKREVTLNGQWPFLRDVSYRIHEFRMRL